MKMNQLKRSKSECDILKEFPRRGSRLSRASESYNDVFVVDSVYDDWGDKRDVFNALEVKMDRLSDLFEEQCRVMNDIKEELRDSKTVAEKYELAQSQLITEVLKTALAESNNNLGEVAPLEEFNSRARSLLQAIESKHVLALDRELRALMLDLLHGEELKDRIVSATVESLQDGISRDIARDMCQVYSPVLRRSNRRLAALLTATLQRGFAELEAHSNQLTNAVCRASRSVRRSLERHRAMLGSPRDHFSYLRYIVELILRQELTNWREDSENLLENWNSNGRLDTTQWAERGASPPPMEICHSPPQPADPNSSPIDQLMQAALIRSWISAGRMNLAFSSALSAGQLSLVVTACRAAPLHAVFSPCRLHHTVLLSLAQQLATDMVHDTQLKCSYLEEVLINLDREHPATRAHLPLVVGELCKNLTNFLNKFPSHVANRRITLIIMAADNLLK